MATWRSARIGAGVPVVLGLDIKSLMSLERVREIEPHLSFEIISFPCIFSACQLLDVPADSPMFPEIRDARAK